MLPAGIGAGGLVRMLRLGYEGRSLGTGIRQIEFLAHDESP